MKVTLFPCVLAVNESERTAFHRCPDLVEREAHRVTNKARKIGTMLRKKVPNPGRVDSAFLVTETSAKVSRSQGRVVRGVPFHTFKTWHGRTSPIRTSPMQAESSGPCRPRRPCP